MDDTPKWVIHLEHRAIVRLDLRPMAPLWRCSAAELLALEDQVELAIAWDRPTGDPRELSEIPEVRLWHLHVDQHCPWLPLLLERSTGQLSRYVAMVVPHGFHGSEGIRFHPEALELWVTARLMVLDRWCHSHGLSERRRLEQMASVLGFALDHSFWTLIDGVRYPAPP